MLAIVLSFDQFPLRLLGCYGNSALEMPSLNRIAAGSVVFDQHFGEDFSPSPEGHAWWTGCYHFPRTGMGLLAEVKSLPELLKESGVENLWVAEKAAGVVPLPAGASVTEVRSFSGMITTACEVLGDWSNQNDRPRLMWLKSGGLAWELERFWERALAAEETPPLADDEDTLSLYRDLMGEAIERCDEELEPLWEKVRELAKSRAVLFILTAGRGLSLGERAVTEGLPSTWAEEFVHLPLIVYHSDNAGGERRSALTQTPDLPATLQDFFALNSSRASEGKSLLPILRGEESTWRESLTYGSITGWEAMRTQGYHLVRLRDSANSEEYRHLLFMKPGDTWDWHDVSSQEPELTESVSEQIDAFLSAAKSHLHVAGQNADPREDTLRNP